MDKKAVWVGLAVLGLSKSNAKRGAGFIGAYAGVACCARNAVEATELLSKEFAENEYELLGFETFLPVGMLDRVLTGYETELVKATRSYPVQFKDIHLHKADA